MPRSTYYKKKTHVSDYTYKMKIENKTLANVSRGGLTLPTFFHKHELPSMTLRFARTLSSRCHTWEVSVSLEREVKIILRPQLFVISFICPLCSYRCVMCRHGNNDINGEDKAQKKVRGVSRNNEVSAKSRGKVNDPRRLRGCLLILMDRPFLVTFSPGFLLPSAHFLPSFLPPALCPMQPTSVK